MSRAYQNSLAVADINTLEDQMDWTLVSLPTTIAARNNYLFTVASTTDITQPTWAEGDVVTLKNSLGSTDNIRILNPSNTITGDLGILSPGDNLLLLPGEAVMLLATSSSTLEIV